MPDNKVRTYSSHPQLEEHVGSRALYYSLMHTILLFQVHYSLHTLLLFADDLQDAPSDSLTWL